MDIVVKSLIPLQKVYVSEETKKPFPNSNVRLGNGFFFNL